MYSDRQCLRRIFQYLEDIKLIPVEGQQALQLVFSVCFPLRFVRFFFEAWHAFVKAVRTAIFAMGISPHPSLEDGHFLLIFHMLVLERQSPRGYKKAIH